MFLCFFCLMFRRMFLCLFRFMFRCMLSHLFWNMLHRPVSVLVHVPTLFVPLIMCDLCALPCSSACVASHVCCIYFPGVCSAAFVSHVRCMFRRISRCLFQCMFCIHVLLHLRVCALISFGLRVPALIPSCLLHSMFLCMFFFFTYSQACSFAFSIACSVVNIPWHYIILRNTMRHLYLFSVFMRRCSA